MGTGHERSPAHHALDRGRFPPGTVLAGRYRIVTALGSGGMGEVFRAEDLKLGQEVALKFLPPGLAGDPGLLARLLREVRVARKVSHPNVCRVYDIVEAEGQHFVAMEYIDGEDLASLLRRIGRLLPDKALEVARQVCAGLGAVHEQGVLHRDLKPANIMIDGRGRARLTDFGLATGATEMSPGELAGTPAYMSPEQIAGEDVSVASDLYALGLVLYEVVVGRPAFTAHSVAEMLRLHREEAPPGPRSIDEGLDPGLERLILRCLDKEPEKRPASALAVAAALPGGDPLAAMLAAGETPPPELVAASGRRGILTPGQALRLATLAVAGLVLGLWSWAHEPVGEMVGGLLPPQVLEHRAREILSELGHGETPVDTAWGYDLDPRASTLLSRMSAREARALVRAEDRPVVRFWYRQSPSPMAPWRTSLPGWQAGERVTPDDPPLTEPGMALVRLGPRGRLLELDVVAGGASPHPKTGELVVSSLLDAAGLDRRTVEHIEPSAGSPLAEGSRMAWIGPGASGVGGPLRVEVVFDGSRPVWIRTAPSGELEEGTRQASPEKERTQAVVGLLYLGFLLGGAVLAGINIRSGRWDRQGAMRLGVAIFALCFLSTLIEGHHTLTLAEEARLVFSAVAYAAVRVLLTCLLYVAIEPFVRRLHPTLLISWSRLLSGRVSDPAVGRDVLTGCGVGAVMGAAFTAWAALRGEDFLAFPILALLEEGALTGARSLAVVLRDQVMALGYALGYTLVYVTSRSALGRARRAAPLGLWLLLALLYGVGFGTWTVGTTNQLALAVVLASCITYLVVRGGLLAAAVGMMFLIVPTFSILSVDPTDWYFAPTAILVLLTLALAVFGVRTSTAGAPLLSSRER